MQRLFEIIMLAVDSPAEQQSCEKESFCVRHVGEEGAGLRSNYAKRSLARARARISRKKMGAELVRKEFELFLKKHAPDANIE